MNNETAYGFQSKCRVCLCQVVQSVDIFEVHPQCGKISAALMECTSINIEDGDHLPTIICAECLQNLQKWFQFRLLCQKSDQTMRDYLNFVTNDVTKPLILAPIDINPEIKTEPPITSEHFDPFTLNPFESPADPTEELEETYDDKEIDFNEEEIVIKEENIQVDDLPAYSEEENIQVDDSPAYSETILPSPVFVCNVCCKYFQKENSLFRHKANAHGKRRYGCDICFKKFRNNSVLKLHRMAKHNEFEPYKCHFCKKRCKTKSHLRLHIRSHATDTVDPDAWKCNRSKLS